MGPLDKVEEAKKAQLLLLWICDKGLEICNTSTWTNEGGNLKIVPVMAVIKIYGKPESNQFLARYHLWCLKQGDRTLEEFVTGAWLLVEDGGYGTATKENTLRATLIFSVACDKIRKDAMVLGNGLTFKQIYDLAKADESSKVQIIFKGDKKFDLYVLQRASGYSTHKPPSRQSFKHETPNCNQGKKDSTERKPLRLQFKSKGCFRCENS